MFSIYTSAFNVLKNVFDYKEALDNFSAFADEVVVAVNTSDDGTLVAIQKHAFGNDKIKVIQTDFSYSDPDLDGKVKNAALQETTEPFKIGLDLDERIPLSNRPSWVYAAELLEPVDNVFAAMVSSIDLYKENTLCKGVGAKWYLHKKGLFRGVVNFAKNSDGTHDITKSDSCELLDSEGNLVPSASFAPIGLPIPEALYILKSKGSPYVLHYGYVDLDRRAKINREFWKNHWSVEAGKPIDVATTVTELEKFPVFEHGLSLL